MKDTTSIEEKVKTLKPTISKKIHGIFGTREELYIRSDAVTIALLEAHTAGASTMLQRVREGIDDIPYTSEALSSNDTRRGYDAMRGEILSHLTTLQKEIDGKAIDIVKDNK